MCIRDRYYIKSEEEMKSLFPYALQALENTQKIADRCLVEIAVSYTHLDVYKRQEYGTRPGDS